MSTTAVPVPARQYRIDLPGRVNLNLVLHFVDSGYPLPRYLGVTAVVSAVVYYSCTVRLFLSEGLFWVTHCDQHCGEGKFPSPVFST